MIENLVHTVTTSALSASAMQIELANPQDPFALPYNGHGYALLMKRESSSTGTCKPVQIEVIEYDGYESDGVTLKVIARGVGNTDALAWPPATVVQQPFLKEHYEELLNTLHELSAQALFVNSELLELYASLWQQSKLIKDLQDSADKLKLATVADIKAIKAKLEALEHNLGLNTQDLSNLALLNTDQEEYLAEICRGMGQSGVYVLRQYTYGGANAYDRPFGVNYSALGIHDHDDFDRLMGMAEGAAIINGKYIRRRHTDYQLVMPAPVGSQFLETVPVHYPDVPVDVAALPPDEQIAQMQKYFEVAAGIRPASDVANFKDAFKLCVAYEEMWEEVFSKEISDTFFSGRHVINAASIQELLKKIGYFNDSGYKDNLENTTYWHSFIKRTDSTGSARLVIRKSRVITMPVGNLVDYPIQDIVELINDAPTMNRLGLDHEAIAKTRSARFRVKHKKASDVNLANQPTLIDELLGKVCGLDGEGAVINEEYNQYGRTERLRDYTGKIPLNSAYYSRFYSITGADASGRSTARRGFNDPTLWVASNTRAEVEPLVVGNETKRFSYLIPLELIVLPPTLQWNPYGVPDKTGVLTRAQVLAMGNSTIAGFVRNGAHYHTPSAFYSNTKGSVSDPADTALQGLLMACADGVARKHSPSGIPTLMREIPNVGNFRLRYPIPFLFFEGSHAQAETEALRNSVYECAATQFFQYQQLLEHEAWKLKQEQFNNKLLEQLAVMR